MSVVVSLPEKEIRAKVPCRPGVHTVPQRRVVRVRFDTSSRAANRYGADIKVRILYLRLETGASAAKIADRLGCSTNFVCDVINASLSQIQNAPNN